MRIRTCAAALAVVAAGGLTTAGAAGAAQAAVVHPAYASGICNEDIAFGPGSDAQGPTVQVVASIEFCGSTTYQPAYVVIYKIVNGAEYFANAGVGSTVYQCQGTTPTVFKLDGEISSTTYQITADCG